MPYDVYIFMGSKSDLPHINKITKALDIFNLSYHMGIASAHKSVNHLLELIATAEKQAEPKVYITVAGRSNALSGLLDCNVVAPVIACPPYSETFGGADVFSSIRMPSGVAPALVLEPINAALFAAKVLGKKDKVAAFQNQQSKKLEDDHSQLNSLENKNSTTTNSNQE